MADVKDSVRTNVGSDDKFDMFSEAEYQSIFKRNQTQKFYPRDKTIPDLFVAQAIRTPHHIALSYNGKNFSYQELDKYTNKLAHYLQKLQVSTESIVTVCLERSDKLVISLLAILKSNAAYMPVETSYPPERAFLWCKTQIQK